MRLLDRGPGGLRLTDAGRVLVERAEAIASHLVAAESELDAVGRLEGGRLRLAAFPTAGATIVVDAISVFRERQPRIVAETDHAPILHGLVAAGVGVTLLPGVSLGGVSAALAVRPLAPPEPRREIDAAVRAGRMPPPAVAAMLGILGELAPGYAAARP